MHTLLKTTEWPGVESRPGHSVVCTRSHFPLGTLSRAEVGICLELALAFWLLQAHGHTSAEELEVTGLSRTGPAEM